jgi:hypothetical protein
MKHLCTSTRGRMETLVCDSSVVAHSRRPKKVEVPMSRLYSRFSNRKPEPDSALGTFIAWRPALLLRLSVLPLAPIADAEPRPPGFILQQNAVSATPGAIEGLLKDHDGKPVEDALVAAVPDVPGVRRAAEMTRSGNLGRFRIQQLPPGPYALTATAPNCQRPIVPGCSWRGARR